MPSQRYEYRVEPISVAPAELRDQRYTVEETLDETAREGWVLDETLRIDSSSFLLVFRRPVPSAEGPS